MTYAVTPGSIYSVLEPTLGVVSACLPAVKPVIIHLLGPGTLNWGRRDAASKDLSGEASVWNRRNGPIKGNITCDIERLDDEIRLHKVRDEHSRDSLAASGTTLLSMEREFTVHRSEETMV